MLTTTGVVDLRPQKVCVSLLGRPSTSGAPRAAYYVVSCIRLVFLCIYTEYVHMFYLFIYSFCNSCRKRCFAADHVAAR